MTIRASSRLVLAFTLCLSSVAHGQADSSRSVPIAPLVRVRASLSGASVATIDSVEISHSTAPTFSEVLQARRPGTRVLRSGGLVNDGALVMLRGPTSLIGANTPLVIVDGVRVDSRQFDQPLGIGAVAPSRLDDLLPEEIERIDVLSGAAAALYGDGAANGVILVTTKSGGAGPLHFSSRASWSATQDNAEYPANYQRVGVSPSTGQPVSDCSLAAVAGGRCTPTGLRSWNPLEQASPFRTGNSALGRLTLGGFALGTSIYTGVTATGRQGALPRDAADRISFRAKAARALPAHFTLEASGGSLREHARSAVDGNFDQPSNILLNGLLGAAQDDANRGYGPPLLPDSIFPAARLRHNTGGVTLRWEPAEWLHTAVMTGRDLVTQRWHADHIGPGVSSSTPDHRYNERNDIRTSGATLSAAYSPLAAIDASTTLGLEREVTQRATFDSIGAPPLLSYSQSELHTRSTALWLTEAVHFPRQLSITASMERVTSSIFGAHAGKEWFPSVNLSWSPSVEGHGFSDVRFRAAYAEAPGASTSLLSVLGIPVSPFGPPPPPPRMERTKEIEVGGEATIGGLTSAGLTAFMDRSTRLWAIGPAQLGAPAAQVGAMTNKGVEALVRTRLLDLPLVRWDGAFSVAVLHNRITRLPVSYAGTVRNLALAGHPLGGVLAQPYTYADVNHDGIIAESEVQLGAAQYAGPPLPTLETAFESSLNLPGHVVLSALLDYRRGNQVVDETSQLRCEIQNCRETEDPTAPLELQAAAVASRLTNYSITGFVSDAAFMRVREIALRWTIPPAALRYVGVDADLTLAGRNLATWTNYRGLDPEISYRPPESLTRQELFTMPLAREFVLRLDVRP